MPNFTINASTAQTLARVWLILIASLTLGCSTVKVQQDYRPNTDFSALKTYSWRQVSTDIQGADKQRLLSLADRQLINQGYHPVGEAADMLLDLNVISRISKDSSTGIGFSIGLPIGQHASIGLGSSKSLNQDKLEGVILIDITDNKSSVLLWRGSAEGIPMKDFSLRNEARLSNLFAELLQQFPPN